MSRPPRSWTTSTKTRPFTTQQPKPLQDNLIRRLMVRWELPVLRRSTAHLTSVETPFGAPKGVAALLGGSMQTHARKKLRTLFAALVTAALGTLFLGPTANADSGSTTTHRTWTVHVGAQSRNGAIQGMQFL